MSGFVRSDDILAEFGGRSTNEPSPSSAPSKKSSNSGSETGTAMTASKTSLKPSDTYILAQSFAEDANVSARIAIRGGTLASYARSLHPSRLTRADLNALALEQYAACIEGDHQREAASVLKTLYEINKDKIAEKAANLSLDLVSEAMARMKDQAIVVDIEESKP